MAYRRDHDRRHSWNVRNGVTQLLNNFDCALITEPGVRSFQLSPALFRRAQLTANA